MENGWRTIVYQIPYTPFPLHRKDYVNPRVTVEKPCFVGML